MAFSEADLYRAKSYMHAEEETDEVITDFLEMSEEYLKDAGIIKNNSNKARYRIALFSVALHFYDNRDAGNDVPAMPGNTQRLINQLKPYP